MGVEVGLEALPVLECSSVIDEVDIFILGPRVRCRKPRMIN